MMNTKKLGFGLMRLPLTDPADATKVDYDTLCKMADRYMEAGFNYFDTAILTMAVETVKLHFASAWQSGIPVTAIHLRTN